MPNTLAVIPARAGSKGVPGKNIKPLAGKPLIAHTIEQAHASRHVTRVVVSTDGEQIAEVGRRYGAEIIARPAALSGDEATSESALAHVLDALQGREGYEPELVVFLQCTSPIRLEGDIDRAIEALRAAEADSLLSVVPSHAFLWGIRDGEVQSLNYDYRSRPRRQDRDPEYRENGSIYVFKPWVLHEMNNRLGGKIALYEMTPWSSVDIDTIHDFALCEWILRQPGSTARDN
jgi:N-acylneuraminate cytidylyltransferase